MARVTMTTEMKVECLYGFDLDLFLHCLRRTWLVELEEFLFGPGFRFFVFFLFHLLLFCWLSTMKVDNEGMGI